jgi:hypothetical protein
MQGEDFLRITLRNISEGVVMVYLNGMDWMSIHEFLW